MKKELVCLVFFLNTLYGFSQTDLKKAPYTRYVVEEMSDTFLISTKPITNREYLIYVMWVYNVYVDFLPEYFIAVIPGMDTADKNLMYAVLDECYESPTPFQIIFKYAPGFVKDYIFNPKYIDYPLIGLSQVQANRLCKWLSDRYNENKLIQYGYLARDTFPLCEKSFVTESYLAEQFYSSKIKEQTAKWSDRIVIPAFRIPTSKELNAANSKNMLSKEFKPYKFLSKSFLNYWHELYLRVDGNSLLLNYAKGKTEVIESIDKGWKIDHSAYEELTFDNEGADRSKQIKDYYDIDKDSLGYMPYVIIEEDANKEPVIIESYLNKGSNDKDKPRKLYFFRFACSTRPGQFKK